MILKNIRATQLNII